MSANTNEVSDLIFFSVFYALLQNFLSLGLKNKKWKSSQLAKGVWENWSDVPTLLNLEDKVFCIMKHIQIVWFAKVLNWERSQEYQSCFLCNKETRVNIHNPCQLLPVSLLIQICPWKSQRLARLKTLAVPPDKTQGSVQCSLLILLDLALLL